MATRFSDEYIRKVSAAIYTRGDKSLSKVASDMGMTYSQLNYFMKNYYTEKDSTKVGKQTAKGATLCWNCCHAVADGVCSWFKDYTPVDGWIALESSLSYRSVRIGSFHVLWCPLFKADPPRPKPKRSPYKKYKKNDEKL